LDSNTQQLQQRRLGGGITFDGDKNEKGGALRPPSRLLGNDIHPERRSLSIFHGEREMIAGLYL
jgi:hypothetical protein